VQPETDNCVLEHDNMSTIPSQWNDRWFNNIHQQHTSVMQCYMWQTRTVLAAWNTDKLIIMAKSCTSIWKRFWQGTAYVLVTSTLQG